MNKLKTVSCTETSN